MDCFFLKKKKKINGFEIFSLIIIKKKKTIFFKNIFNKK